MGAHGEQALEFMFRLGGLTAPQLAELLGISDPAASRTLKTLQRSRLAEQNAVKAWWHPANGRPRSFYYLSSRDSGRGVVYGAYLAGEENERRARASYKLCQLPARAAHASLRNEYYLMLAAGMGDGVVGAFAPREEMWSESHPDFPYLDEGSIRSDRKNARRKYGRVFPDGLFELVSTENPKLFSRYLLEVETQARTKKLFSKIDGFGSYFHRRLGEEAAVSEWLMPVVFLFRQNSTMLHAAKTVLGAVQEGAPKLSRYLAWRDAAAEEGIHAGRLLLFGSLEDLSKNGALGSRYGVLQRYPEGVPGVARNPTQVSLGAAGREVAEAATRAAGGASR